METMTGSASRLSQKRALKALGIIMASLAVIVARTATHGGMRSGPADASGGSAVVERVVDGDTVVLDDGRHVRLIGIDTPEVHYSDKLVRDAKRSRQDVRAIQGLGRRAAKFTKDLVSGKRVRLEYDVTKRDRYGRTLAYLYLDDGTFVNARIVEEGYAQTLSIPPNVKHASLFLELQRKARTSAKGLWSDTVMTGLSGKDGGA